MRALISGFIKLVVLVFMVFGGYLLYTSQTEKITVQESYTNKKALAFKKFLIKFQKPQRIEVNSLTKRMSADAEEVKKVKASLDPNANFYMSVDLFTDENDPEAPLVAEVKFFDVASQNKMREVNVNLE
ncbi:MAG: hypothetical protein ACXVAX_02385 [Pseudobdellovibrio sp.]